MRSAALSVLVVLGIGGARAGGMLAAATGSGADLGSADPALRHDGLVVGVGLVAGALAGIGVLAAVVRPEPARRLALAWPSLPAVIGWTLAAGLLTALGDLATRASGQPWPEPGWLDVYRTAPPGLLAVGLVAASVVEELFLRGFVYTWLADTRAGAAGAIGVTATLLAVLHLPADPVRIGVVFASGLVLGLARHRTGSALTGIPAHALGNLWVLVTLSQAA